MPQAQPVVVVGGSGPAGAVPVDLTEVNGSPVATGHGTASGALRVELPTDGTGVVGLNAGENHIGQVGGTLANPTSTLTRPNDTNAYAQNDLIASSTTAGSVVVPSITVTRIAAGSCAIRRLRLATNVTTGWGSASFTVRLWTTAPTYTNGDNGAYAVATGSAGFLGAYSISISQWADGASGNGLPLVGNEVGIKLASGSIVYWDLQYTGSASLTPIAQQTFTLTAETYQD